MKLTPEGAIELADAFGNLAGQLRRWRYDNSAVLSNAHWDNIAAKEWSLLNASEDIVTMAVGLKIDELQDGLAGLRGTTNKAKKAIQTIKDAKKVIQLATALVVFAAAIVSKEPAAIARSGTDLVAKLNSLTGDG